MVDEAGAVPSAALPDLIHAAPSGGLHDVKVADATGDDADELANRGAAFKWLDSRC